MTQQHSKKEYHECRATLTTQKINIRPSNLVLPPLSTFPLQRKKQSKESKFGVTLAGKTNTLAQ